jgi:hypothetical protein
LVWQEDPSTSSEEEQEDLEDEWDFESEPQELIYKTSRAYIKATLSFGCNALGESCPYKGDSTV